MKQWRVSIIAAVIVAQFGLPAFILLAKEPPGRFGFQMYSGYGVDVELINAEGQALEFEDVNVTFAAKMRPELDWMQILTDRLCSEVPDLAMITITVTGRKSEIARCSH